MTNKKMGVKFLLGAIFGLTSLLANEPQAIMGGEKKNILEGYIYNNSYSITGILNPAKHSGNVTSGDFRILPLQTVNGTRTLDNTEAKVRLFLRPEVVVRNTARRRALVRALNDWQMTKAKNVLELSRNFGNAEAPVKTVIRIAQVPKKAQMDLFVEISNKSESAYNVEFQTIISSLFQLGSPVQVTIPRSLTRFQMGGQVTYWHQEVTELNGNYEKYWWRNVENAKGARYNTYLERVIFDDDQLKPPPMAAVMNLLGHNTVVFDFNKTLPLTRIEMRTSNDCYRFSPEWNFRLAGKETKQLKFRIMTIKKLPRVDSVTNDWVFAYVPERDNLHLMMAPLRPVGRLAVTMNVSDTRGTVLANQRTEVKSMSPFDPGEKNYSLTSSLYSNNRYPIKVVLNSLQDNSKLLDISGLVTP